MKHPRLRTLSSSVAALTAAALVAAPALLAGPVSPPAGAVGPTMKTLTEVEARTAINAANTPGDAASVYTISQPGSYYLTGNISGVSGKSGIHITAANVTLDLNGFTLTGVAGALDGVNVDGGDAGSTVTIRNGTARNWPGSGVSVLRDNATVQGVTALNNGPAGISIVNSGRIIDCTARNNTGIGIYVGRGCTVRGSVAAGNGAAAQNDGFVSNSNSTFVDCAASDNIGAGFSVGAGSHVERCTADHNLNGITTYGAALVTACTANANTGDGILAGQGATVRGCTSSNNGDDGIHASSRSVIVGNTCENNSPAGTGAGIYLAGTACRIEDNHLDYNHYGIIAPATSIDNFIARNTARGNTANFSISAGNELAPVITNPGGSSFSTMTPWSNVAF